MGVTCRAAFHPRHVHRCGGSEHTRRNLFALHHILKWSAKTARLPPSGCIRIASLAAPAINQSGRGSCAVFIAASVFAAYTPGERRLSMRGSIFAALRRYAFLPWRSLFRIPHSEFRISNPAFPSPSPQKKGGASPSRLFWLSGLLLIVLFILGAQFYRGLVPAGLFQTVEVAVQLAPDMVRAVFAHYRPHRIYVGVALLHLVFLPFKD